MATELSSMTSSKSNRAVGGHSRATPEFLAIMAIIGLYAASLYFGLPQRGTELVVAGHAAATPDHHSADAVGGHHAAVSEPGEHAGTAPADPAPAGHGSVEAPPYWTVIPFVLLLGAIEHLSRTSRLRCRSSETSREVLRAYQAEPEQRRALQRLVEAVERSIFGGRPLPREEFDACRGYAQSLLQGQRG